MYQKSDHFQLQSANCLKFFYLFLKNPHKPYVCKRNHLVIKAAASKYIHEVKQRMKKLSNQEMKKIAKSTLALVLAGTFTFSPMAMANDDTDTVDLRSYENLTTTVSEEEIEEAKTQVEDLEETNPSLIPGDFFYFAKIALEKIRLAFTFDNAKEAELLAAYASERLAEASALFSEGKEEEALLVIEDAVQYMENSQIIVDEETKEEQDDQKEEETDSEEESQENTDSEDSTDDEIPDDELNEEDPAADEDATEEEVEEEVAKDPFEEIEDVLRHNIIALTAAMEKVQNPTAKAALQRNIDKTYAKMAKKLAKLEEKYGELPKEEENTETTEPVVVDPVVEPESDLLPADEVVEAPADETMPADDDTTVPAVLPAKSVKDQAKQQHKAEKAAIKQERKAEKQEVKQQKKETKHQAKQDKHEGKKSNNQNHKGNGKEGKGKEKH
jgi:hypothetical protein